MTEELKSPVPSPCINLCEMGQDGLCLGCLRTIEEIINWSSAGDDYKRVVWNEIRRREERIQFD
ncbi:DUF1289 domain-containing protein [Massilia cavernae]|uniref:DUF1289 domain-containing protein n=1 Tax=Massilia cavernae TaxID=2320864 RepID=A0A418XTA8_9BURK|nr:DUF1289 domain-containing protein [Massilia cavernae]RJG15888.1 DUF1289 domain-containing protein [Massilia cavernae]